MTNSSITLWSYLLFSLSLMTLTAHGAESDSEKVSINKSLVISHAWIRLMPPIASSTAAYFTLENHRDKAIEIVNISTSIAKKSTMHNIVMDNDMASMVPLTELVIASGEKVIFSPGGKHLMIVGLTEKLAENKDVSVIFELKNAEKIITRMKIYKNNPNSLKTDGKVIDHKNHH